MNRAYASKWYFVLLFILSLGSGCAPLPEAPDQGQGLTPVQRKLNEQVAAFNKTVWEGILVGCIGGTVVGVLISDDPASIVDATSIGCAIGSMAGSYVAERQKDYSNREDTLDSIIDDLHQKNQKVNELITTIREVIAEDKRKIDDLNKKYQQGLVTEQQLFQEFAIVKLDRNNIAQALQNANKQLAFFKDAKQTYEKDNPGTNTVKLNKEVHTFQESIATMNNIVKQLSSPEIG